MTVNSSLIFDESEQRGRKSLSIDLRQDVYDFWKVNSTISVHYSNSRHLVTISEDNFNTSDIQDKDISKLENGKFQAHRLVSMKPYRKLHEIYCQISEFQPSFGSFVKLKSFYVSPPTNKEMEMCLCSKCLNPHCIYKMTKNGIKRIDLPHSMTEFLCTEFNCQRNKTVNYYNKDCIEE